MNIQLDSDGAFWSFAATRRTPLSRVVRDLLRVLGDQIHEMLRQGTRTCGCRGDLWTRERAAEVVRRTFGVACTPHHIGRLLREYRPKRGRSSPPIDALDATAPESHMGAIYR
jgi:hypothetical protein